MGNGRKTQRERQEPGPAVFVLAPAAGIRYTAPMATKFSDFLQQNKIDPRRLIGASRNLEMLTPEDRAIRLKERIARRSEEGITPEMKKSRTKPHTGRPVTKRAVDAATTGKPLTGPQKNRLLRAVNRIREQRKQEPVDLRALF